MKILITLLLLTATIFSFDAKEISKVFCENSNEKVINKVFKLFIPFTTNRMKNESSFQDDSKRYLSKFCYSAKEIDSTLEVLSDEAIESLTGDKIVKIYNDMINVILTYHKVTDTLDIDNITTALACEKMDVYNHLISKIPSKDELIESLTLLSVDWINNTTTYQKRRAIIEMLLLLGAPYLDEFTIKTFYMYENATTKTVVDTLISQLEKLDNKEANEIVKYLKDNKSSVKMNDIINKMSTYLKVVPSEIKIKGTYNWGIGPTDIIAKGTFLEFIQFLVEDVLSQNLENKNLLVGTENNANVRMNGYNERTLYFLLFCTDDNYMPLMPLEKVYETNPYSLAHKNIKK